MMKKTIIFTLLMITVLLAVGCTEYKTFDNSDSEETDLLNEIAEIERQLDESDLAGEALEPAVVEETIEVDENSREAIVINVNENDLITLQTTIVDPDEDTISYTFTPPIDQNGQWKTNYGDAGEYSIMVSATDGVHTTEQEVILVVQRVNVAPVIEAVTNLQFSEGDVIKFTPSVNDPNNDEVVVEVSEPLASGEFETDHTSSGDYNIIVTATDGEFTTETAFTLSISNVNVLPVISNVNDITVNEGETVTFEALVEDLDGDEVEVTLSEPVGNDGVWDTSFTDNGEYRITVTADDGQDLVSTSVLVTVEDVNMPPEIISVELVKVN